jgi:CheY-like chemotaxis protein
MHRVEREILDALRLNASDAVRLMRQIQQRQHPAEQERRGSTRVCYEKLAGVTLHVMHPGGSRQSFQVLPCDLGPGGAGLLHGNFLYPNTTVLLQLPDRKGREQRLAGKVAWCVHVQGRVHGLGIEFDRVLDTAEFSDEAAAAAAAAVTAPPRLRGRVLYGDADPASRDAVRQVIEAVGPRMTAVANAGELAPAARDLAPDAIMLDVHFAAKPSALIQRIAALGVTAPVFVVLDASTGDLQKPLVAAGAQTLGRPLNDADLYAALQPHLRQDQSDADPGDRSSHADDPALRPLVRAFALRVEEAVAGIADMARDSESAMIARDLCVELISQAGNYGYSLLARLLRRLLVDLHDPAERQANLGRCQDLARRIHSGAVPLTPCSGRRCA